MGAISAAFKARHETLLNASDVSSWTTAKPQIEVVFTVFSV